MTSIHYTLFVKVVLQNVFEFVITIHVQTVRTFSHSDKVFLSYAGLLTFFL